MVIVITSIIIMLILASLTFHELNHAIVMRKCGVPVEKIGVLGWPFLWAVKLPIRHSLFPETEWLIHPFTFMLGAYVKVSRIDIEALSSRERLQIWGAGPLSNISFAILLYGILLFATEMNTFGGSIAGFQLILSIFIAWSLLKYQRFICNKYVLLPLVVGSVCVTAYSLTLHTPNANIDSGLSDFVAQMYNYGIRIEHYPVYLQIASVMKISALLSLMIGVVNFLPLMPLDGGRIVNEFVPISWRKLYSQISMPFIIIMLLFMIGKDIWNLTEFVRSFI